MKININDASNYFKGMLLLIRKDLKITKTEEVMMMNIGKALGFEKEFCENAIRDILDNPHIEDIPPQFSSKALAIKFIKDGLSVASSDNEIHPHEEHWLRTTAEKNGLDEQWFLNEKTYASARQDSNGHLEVHDLILGY
jgi:hypothetical protein